MKRSKAGTRAPAKGGKRGAPVEPKVAPKGSRVATTRAHTRTHYVPRLVLRTAIAGVVPVCVTASSASCRDGGAGVAFVGYMTQPERDAPGSVASISYGPPISTVDSTADLYPGSDAPEGSVGDSPIDGSSDAGETGEASFGDAGLDAPEGD